MRPDLSRERGKAWIALGVSLVLVAGAVWWVYDWGAAAAAKNDAQARWDGMSRGEKLGTLLDRQRQANKDLAQTIGQLKTLFGMKRLAPFLLPPGETQPGNYFNTVHQRYIEMMYEKARARSISLLSRDLGFVIPEGRVPAVSEVPFLLTSLQLSVKALDLALSDDLTSIKSVKVSHKDPRLTGPDDRPTLLREYPITLTVRGSLKDIQWLLHRLGSDQADAAAGEPAAEHFPLIVTGLSISSENRSVENQDTVLDATFELAGMEFLSDVERAAIDAEMAAKRGPRAAAATTSSRAGMRTGTGAGRVIENRSDP